MSVTPDKQFVQLPVGTARWRRLLGLNGSLSLVLLPLAELEQTQAVSCLTPAELERFAQFAYPKRKLEWLGGRIVAKYAAMSAATGQDIHAVQQWPVLEVVTAADGRPFIRAADIPDRPLPDISISHSHGLAAAMAVVHGRCGVDIQKVTPSVVRIKKKFAAPAEVAILHNLTGSDPDAPQLTLLWAAKEALKKAIGARKLPGFLEVKLSGAASDKDGEIGDYFVFDFKLPDSITSRAMDTFSVVALFYEKHVLAFTGVAEQCML